MASRNKQKKTLPNMIIFICLVLISIYLIQNFLILYKRIYSTHSYIFKHLGSSYDQKMTNYWGFYYDYMVFVKNHTEEHSTMMVPPQESPWLKEGNVLLDNYFLYPRTLLPGINDEIGNNVDYILIAKGSQKGLNKDKYGWPKVFIQAEKIIYFDENTKKITEVAENFDPKDLSNREAWGLIKVKKQK